MARLTIEDCWWSDPRREALGNLVGGEEFADIVAVKAWRLAQQFWKQGRKPIPKHLFDLLRSASELLRVGLAVVRDDGVYVAGSAAYLDWLNQKQAAGKIGGVKSAQARRKKHGTAQPKPRSTPEAESKVAEASSSSSSSSSFSLSSSISDSLITDGVEKSTDKGARELEVGAGKGVEANPAEASPTALAWRAYRDAFEKRHGSKPPQNKTLMGQLSQFVKRLPAADAPAVAAFYLTHTDAYYNRAMHPVGLLLRDAEKLYTEWKTGQQITGVKARQQETYGHAADQLRRIREGTL
jgi:hypothetical protein